MKKFVMICGLVLVRIHWNIDNLFPSQKKRMTKHKNLHEKCFVMEKSTLGRLKNLSKIKTERLIKLGGKLKIKLTEIKFETYATFRCVISIAQWEVSLDDLIIRVRSEWKRKRALENLEKSDDDEWC